MFGNEALWKLKVPTKIYYGRGITQEALIDLHHSSSYLSGNVLIVTGGHSLERLGYVDVLIDMLDALDRVSGVMVYNGVSPNPKLSEVNKGIQAAKKCNANAVIGFGGGSVLDAAKAIGALAKKEHSIEDYFYGRKQLDTDVVPVIAMPTTAGTGSELSKGAILSDEVKQIKSGLRGEVLYPVAAIVDSRYTETVPFQVTMETGFDTLTHAVESYVSQSATPFTSMLSEYVMREGSTALRKLAVSLNDVKARAQMSYCSMLMGINIGNVGNALPHRMQYPVGAHTGTSHAAGLAALYTAWLKHERQYTPDRVDRIYDLLGCGTISELLGELKLPQNLKGLGVTEEMLAIMPDEVSGNLACDPASIEPDIIRKIYQESY